MYISMHMRMKKCTFEPSQVIRSEKVLKMQKHSVRTAAMNSLGTKVTQERTNNEPFDHCKWLTENGFDREWCVQSAAFEEASFALFKACAASNLEACKHIAKGRGDIKDMRNGTSNDSLAHVACRGGNIDLCAWLKAQGCDLRSTNRDGHTSFWIACSQNDLPVAKWLHAHGAAGDLQVPSARGLMPVSIAMSCSHHRMVSWLLRIGAANNSDGTMMLDTFSCSHHTMGFRAALLICLDEELDARATFLTDAQPVMWGNSLSFERPIKIDHVTGADTTGRPNSRRKKARSFVPLTMLAGISDAIMSVIVDFIGFARGRELSNIRAAHILLKEEIHVCNEFS